MRGRLGVRTCAMRLRPLCALPLLALACSGSPAAPPVRECEAAANDAGTAGVGQRNGGALLPNGDGLAPLGERMLIGQSPLNFVLAPDGVTVALAEFGLDQWAVELATAAPGAPLARNG